MNTSKHLVVGLLIGMHNHDMALTLCSHTNSMSHAVMHDI